MVDFTKYKFHIFQKVFLLGISSSFWKLFILEII